MNAHLHLTNRTSPRLLVAAIALVLLAAFAIASIVGLAPGTAMPERKQADAFAAAAPSPRVQTTACPDCGTVVAIKTFELREGARPVTAAAGGAPSIVPARSSDVARARIVYRVTVHMEDGSYRTVSHGEAPAFGIGHKVRVIQSTVVAQKS